MNADEGDRMYFDPEMVSLTENIPIAEIQNRWKYDSSEFKREFEDHAQSEPEIESDTAPHDIGLEIKGVAEHLPIVLKEETVPNLESFVFKSGMETDVTEGEVLETDTEATVKPGSRTIYLQNQFKTDKMGEKGDSGSFVLTKDTYEPAGIFSAIGNGCSFHTKLSDISESIDAVGFFAPISLPDDIPSKFERVISIILPDGVFKQCSNLTDHDWRKIARDMEIPPDQFDNGSTRSDDYATLDIPDRSSDVGSLWFTEDGRPIGIETTSSMDGRSAIMKIEHVLNALDLELITGLDRKSIQILERAGYWNLRCAECGSIMSPVGGCWFCG